MHCAFRHSNTIAAAVVVSLRASLQAHSKRPGRPHLCDDPEGNGCKAQTEADVVPHTAGGTQEQGCQAAVIYCVWLFNRQRDCLEEGC